MTPPLKPLGLLAELTHRCPLKCPYCSNPLALSPSSTELSTAVWIRVLDEAADLGVVQVHLSGGEPTARRDLRQLVSHAASRGLYSNLITSGLLLEKREVERLAEAGLDHIQLSIQDAEAASADRFGGLAGAHEKKIEFSRIVREAGLPLTINAVVHRNNIGNLRAMIDLAVVLGAQRLEVAHVQYHGWALRNRAALMPTRQQVERASETVQSERDRLKGRLVIDYVLSDYHASYPKSCMGGWGRRFLIVTPEGKVLPCHAAETVDGVVFERVTERSLEDIWTRSDAFRRFRGTDWMRDPCRSCDRREIDWGGCRCQAMSFTGRADAVDPACALSPVHCQLATVAEREAQEKDASFVYRRRSAAQV